MSLIIFAGIVVGLPRAIGDLYEKCQDRSSGDRLRGLALILLMAMMIAVVAFIVFVEGGQRRIPVQYAKRVVGRKMMGGQMTYLAAAREFRRRDSADFCQFVAHISRSTIGLMFGQPLAVHCRPSRTAELGRALYTVVYITLIILFAFFYVGIVFNPTELADNMRKYGGFIPGHSSGTQHLRTYQHRILKRLTFVGGVYLAVVCLLPEWMIAGIHLHHLPGLGGDWFDNHMWRLGSGRP